MISVQSHRRTAKMLFDEIVDPRRGFYFGQMAAPS
jgi:hypothetical protein